MIKSVRSKLAQFRAISKKLSYLCVICNQPSIIITRLREISTSSLHEIHRPRFWKGLTYAVVSFFLSLHTWSICHPSLVGWTCRWIGLRISDDQARNTQTNSPPGKETPSILAHKNFTRSEQRRMSEYVFATETRWKKENPPKGILSSAGKHHQRSFLARCAKPKHAKRTKVEENPLGWPILSLQEMRNFVRVKERVQTYWASGNIHIYIFPPSKWFALSLNLSAQKNP